MYDMSWCCLCHCSTTTNSILELVLCQDKRNFQIKEWTQDELHALGVPTHKFLVEERRGWSRSEMLCHEAGESWARPWNDRNEYWILAAFHLSQIRDGNKQLNPISKVCETCLRCSICARSYDGEGGQHVVMNHFIFSQFPSAALLCVKCKNIVCQKCGLIDDWCLKCLASEGQELKRKFLYEHLQCHLPNVCALFVISFAT
jgi:hypothetical protein